MKVVASTEWSRYSQTCLHAVSLIPESPDLAVGSTSIHVYSLSEVTKDKRLIAQKLIKIVNDNIASCQEDINKLQRDLFDGEKRFQEWNALAKRMNEILYSFSYTFREANRYNFERVTKP